MAKRRTISKRTRFEVFKRDKFRCQYCGKEAPSVVLALRAVAFDAGDVALHADGLHVDHVVPRVAGGDDNITNYVTACVDCNLGKGPIPLDDDAAVQKQRAQIEDVATRREQLEMMAQWQRDVAAIDASGVDVAVALWKSLVPGTTLNPVGEDAVAKALRRFGPEAVLDAMRTAVNAYARRDAEGGWDHSSLSDVLDKLIGICVNRQKQEKLPELPKLYYIRGILRNRFPDRWDNAEVMRLLQRAARAGMDVEALQDHAQEASTYWRWKNDLAERIEDVETAPENRVLQPTPGPTPSAHTPLAIYVLRLCTERWGSSVDAEAVRLRIDRSGYTTTQPLWITWSTRHAVTFPHWCAIMDMAEAAERIAEMMLALPLPPYPPVMPKDISDETQRALDRTMRSLVLKFGTDGRTTAQAKAVATALLYGFTEEDLVASINANVNATGWWVDVEQATELAMRFRAPQDPFAPGLEQAE